MPSDAVLYLALGVGVLVIGLFAYAGYLGLRARAVLLDRLYKARASWVSSVAVLFVFLISANLVIGTLASDNWVPQPIALPRRVCSSDRDVRLGRRYHQGREKVRPSAKRHTPLENPP